MIVGAMKDYKLKLRILHTLDTLGSVGRKNSKPNLLSIVTHGSHGLRCENRPSNRPPRRETGLKMPCCPASDLLRVAKWHVRVSKQSCKQANRLILWGVRTTIFF
jgi:hypothetical protein